MRHGEDRLSCVDLLAAFQVLWVVGSVRAPYNTYNIYSPIKIHFFGRLMRPQVQGDPNMRRISPSL